MILPELVFGRSSTAYTLLGRLILPAFSATAFRSSFSYSSLYSSWSLSRSTNATGTWPLSSSSMPMTAASAMPSHPTSAFSISTVERRCPETFRTSSMRPVMV
jgi:hypothetical protein